MKRLHLVVVLLVVGLLALAGCAPKAAPAPVPKAKPEATPVAPAAQAPVPKATPTLESTPRPAPARPAWQAEWEKTLAEAKKEGKVVVYGAPGAEIRRALIEEFQKAYPGITVEYTGLTGSQAAPKAEAERRGGLYLVDLHIGGTTSIVTSLKQYAQPIEQFLILPEVKDVKNWRDGKLEFSDTAGRYNLVFCNFVFVLFAYNTELLPPQKAGQFSLWDITKPEWKGKVIWTDPRVAGPGQSVATFFYANPRLGPDFMRAMAKSDVALGRDQRQMGEWVGRGKYTLQIGADVTQATELAGGGLPIRMQSVVKEGAYMSADYGSVIVMDRAPHPNAAAVYLNWLLTKEGQTVWSRGGGFPSRRVDVPTAHLDPSILPQPGVEYYRDFTEAAVMGDKVATRELVKEVFGK